MVRGEALSDREDANPASALVNHDQGAGREVGLVLVESSERLGWFSGWLRGGPLTPTLSPRRGIKTRRHIRGRGAFFKGLHR